MAAIINALLTASGLAYALFAAGLLAAIRPAWRRISWALLAASGAVTIIFSSGMVATSLMSPLEYEFPAVNELDRDAGIKHIVVLTGYAADDADMPVTARLNYSSAYRVMMALQLAQQCRDCDVVISGKPMSARVTRDALVSMGFPSAKVTLETASATTAQSAANLRPMLGDRPFLLVTSAGHLTRSISSMRAHGLAPMAVPTDYQGPKEWQRAELRPAPSWLVTSDLAIHEYIGRIWYRLRGAA